MKLLLKLGYGIGIKMQFIVDIESLDKMLVFIREEALKLKIHPKAIQKMELACEEAFVNIISYAHPNPSNDLFIDCFLVDKTHFEVVIKDKGPPFNPLEVNIDPQKNIAVHERKIGGLGIYLIRKLIDEAIYLREDEFNVLRLTLRLEVPQLEN